jgi:hypothetical protein
MEQYQLDRVKAHLQIVRYLMIAADNRGLTHGEKHHFIQVALSEIATCLRDLGDHGALMVRSDGEPSPSNVSIADIPF